MPQDVLFTFDKTFSAQSTDGAVAADSTSSKLAFEGSKDGPSGDTALGPQALFCTALMSTAAATATLIAKVTVMGADGVEKVIYQENAAISITTNRTVLAGTSGDYLATVTWTGTNAKTFDCGMVTALGKAAKLYFICTALSAGTIQLIGVATRNAG